MADHRKQNCVLCDAPAEYCLADFGKRKQFTCSTCTEYQITDSAEEKLADAPNEWRQKFSEKAKSSGHDVVLSISVPSIQKSEGSAYESLRGELLKRADLPPCR